MKRRLLPLILLCAPLLRAEEDVPSPVSLTLEAGIATPGGGFGADHEKASLAGLRVTYDKTPRWSASARLNRRNFRRSPDDGRRVTAQALTGAAVYRLRAPSWWTPYTAAELGVSQNRRAAAGATTSAMGHVYGLGAGVEFNFFELHAIGLEAVRRTITKASIGGHAASETALSLLLTVYLPDRWIPIKPKTPLIFSEEVETGRPATVSSADVNAQQAQKEINAVMAEALEGARPDITFLPGQSELKETSSETLEVIGTLLRKYPNISVRITGHTDEMSTDADNDILALARAQTVRTYLTENFALPADKVTTDSAGAGAPLVDNTYEKGQTANRRIEFTITP